MSDGPTSEQDWLLVEGAIRRSWQPAVVAALERLREREQQMKKDMLELIQAADSALVFACSPEDVDESGGVADSLK